MPGPWSRTRQLAVAQRDLDGAARRRPLDRVVEQVGDRPVEPAARRRSPRTARGRSRTRVPGRVAARPLDGRGDELVEAHGSGGSPSARRRARGRRGRRPARPAPRSARTRSARRRSRSASGSAPPACAAPRCWCAAWSAACAARARRRPRAGAAARMRVVERLEHRVEARPPAAPARRSPCASMRRVRSRVRATCSAVSVSSLTGADGVARGERARTAASAMTASEPSARTEAQPAERVVDLGQRSRELHRQRRARSLGQDAHVACRRPPRPRRRPRAGRRPPPGPRRDRRARRCSPADGDRRSPSTSCAKTMVARADRIAQARAPGGTRAVKRSPISRRRDGLERRIVDLAAQRVRARRRRRRPTRARPRRRPRRRR